MPDFLPGHEDVRLALLNDIAAALNEANDISAAMDALLPRLGEALGLSTAWAFRFDPKRASFVEVGASGLPPALACDGASALKSGWCECQDRFVDGKLDGAVNIVRCSRLRDAVGDKGGLVFHASLALRSKGKPLGILNLAASGHDAFTDDTLALLGMVGHHVAIAVDRAGILADERQRTEQLRAVSALAATLVSSVNPTHLLQFAVDEFVRVLRYEACGITLPSADEHGAVGVVLVAASHVAAAPPAPEYSYAAELAEAQRPSIDPVLLPDAGSAMVASIPHSEYEVRVESRFSRAFGDLDQDILTAFALHLSAALENARLYQQSLASAKWAERRQLAADLHDAVSQRLFSAQLLARSIEWMLTENHPAGDVLARNARLQRLIAESQEEMRDLIEALRPTDERGLAARLRDRVEPLQLQARTRIQVTVDASLDDALTLAQRESVLHVVDEALRNVLRHADAAHAYVTLTRTDDALLVTVQDDGRGFDETSIQFGLGTSTMYERLHRVGGSLHLHSTPGKGTTVVCELPWARGGIPQQRGGDAR